MSLLCPLLMDQPLTSLKAVFCLLPFLALSPLEASVSHIHNPKSIRKCLTAECRDLRKRKKKRIKGIKESLACWLLCNVASSYSPHLCEWSILPLSIQAGSQAWFDIPSPLLRSCWLTLLGAVWVAFCVYSPARAPLLVCLTLPLGGCGKYWTGPFCNQCQCFETK